MSCPLTPNELTGIAPATLQAWLTDAQNKLAELSTGARVVSIQVTGGGQHRQADYRNDPNSMALLRMWIRQLQAALGVLRPARRALGVSF
jgi:hypothetical protein